MSTDRPDSQPAIRIRYADNRQPIKRVEYPLPSSSMPAPTQQSRVHVSLQDFVRLMTHATVTNRAWVADFADEAIDVPQDLYEVMVAYQQSCRLRAA